MNVAKQYVFDLIFFGLEWLLDLTGLRYLYDFYQTQRARKPDSVHATYLLSGRRCYEERPKPAPTHNQSNGQINGGQDNVPASSPFPSSVPQQEEDGKAEFDLTVISIVKEEDLEGI